MRDLSEYTQDGLQGLTIDPIIEVFMEEKRRVAETGEFFGRFCLLDRKCTLWYLVWRSGGFRRFNEIHTLARSIGVNSHSSVSRYLNLYVKHELAIIQPSGRYRMIGPDYLEH